MPRGKTLELERANNALQAVQSVTANNWNDKDKAKYASYAKSLPATILANGLGQAAATLLAAGKRRRDDPHQALHDHLQGWLCRGNAFAPYPEEDLMKAITAGDRKTYLRAQAEGLAWLVWLKKFAAAYLPESSGD